MWQYTVLYGSPSLRGIVEDRASRRGDHEGRPYEMPHPYDNLITL